MDILHLSTGLTRIFVCPVNSTTTPQYKNTAARVQDIIPPLYLDKVTKVRP